MGRSKQEIWPMCQQVDINLDAQEQGLADAWVVQARREIISAARGVRSPEALYREAAKAGKRWLDHELAIRRRSGSEVPRVRAFVVTYFSDNDRRNRLAVVNVLTGRIDR